MWDDIKVPPLQGFGVVPLWTSCYVPSAAAESFNRATGYFWSNSSAGPGALSIVVLLYLHSAQHLRLRIMFLMSSLPLLLVFVQKLSRSPGVPARHCCQGASCCWRSGKSCWTTCGSCIGSQGSCCSYASFEHEHVGCGLSCAIVVCA